jgi:transcriptional regulator with XRE-family HTH domain
MFPEKLKALRGQRSLTQEKLATELNDKYETSISKSMISRWEKGSTDPQMKYVRIIADYFNVDPSEIMGTTFNPSQELTSLYSQLNDERQKRVVSYARLQLDQQRQPTNIKELYPDTLAAHADDIDHEYTPEELKHNIDFLDEQIDKYNRKHKK